MCFAMASLAGSDPAETSRALADRAVALLRDRVHSSKVLPEKRAAREAYVENISRPSARSLQLQACVYTADLSWPPLGWRRYYAHAPVEGYRATRHSPRATFLPLK